MRIHLARLWQAPVANIHESILTTSTQYRRNDLPKTPMTMQTVASLLVQVVWIVGMPDLFALSPSNSLTVVNRDLKQLKQ